MATHRTNNKKQRRVLQKLKWGWANVKIKEEETPDEEEWKTWLITLSNIEKCHSKNGITWIRETSSPDALKQTQQAYDSSKNGNPTVTSVTSLQTVQNSGANKIGKDREVVTVVTPETSNSHVCGDCGRFHTHVVSIQC
jgi:hypothetical protein